jgi:hypothetical protein
MRVATTHAFPNEFAAAIFTERLLGFVQAAVDFRYCQPLDTVRVEGEAGANVQRFAEERPLFAEMLQLAEAAIATATKYGMEPI